MTVDAQDDLNDKTDKYKITLDQVKDTLANQMTSAIEGLIDGTKTLGESLSGLLRTFGSMFLRSGMGSLFEKIFPSAKGNVFAQNGIVPYAKGGYIGRPTMALMGEAGPEAVLPLRRGRGGRLGVETSGGGVGSVTVNVDATGSAVEGDDAQASQLGKAIGIAVQARIGQTKTSWRFTRKLMATFPSIDPDYGAQKASATQVRTVRFADGYEKRLTYGLNQNPKVWTLSFVNLTETDSDTIETFLDARADDNAAFDWSPPDESALTNGCVTTGLNRFQVQTAPQSKQRSAKFLNRNGNSSLVR